MEPFTSPAALAAALAARRPGDGAPLLVGISGVGGAGKSTLAAALAACLPSAAHIEADDFFTDAMYHARDADWSALDRDRLQREVLTPARAGRDFAYDRWDAYRGRSRGRRQVTATDLVLVEGVGLFTRDFIGAFDCTIWVDVDPAVARARGIARDNASYDGEYAALWHDLWGPNDADFCARHRPQAHADLHYRAGDG